MHKLLLICVWYFLQKTKEPASPFRVQRQRNPVHLCYIMKKKNCQQPKDSKNGNGSCFAPPPVKKEKPAPDGVGPMVTPFYETVRLHKRRLLFLPVGKFNSPLWPCEPHYNLHKFSRWVASTVLLRFQRPPGGQSRQAGGLRSTQ